MKAKVSFTFATKAFENIKPQIEIEVPDMNMMEAHAYFEKMIRGEKKPYKAPTKWQKIQAKKEGFDIDNDPYLDGDQDEGAKRENFAEHNKVTGN